MGEWLNSENIEEAEKSTQRYWQEIYKRFDEEIRRYLR